MIFLLVTNIFAINVTVFRELNAMYIEKIGGCNTIGPRSLRIFDYPILDLRMTDLRVLAPNRTYAG